MNSAIPLSSLLVSGEMETLQTYCQAASQMTQVPDLQVDFAAYLLEAAGQLRHEMPDRSRWLRDQAMLILHPLCSLHGPSRARACILVGEWMRWEARNGPSNSSLDLQIYWKVAAKQGNLIGILRLAQYYESRGWGKRGKAASYYDQGMTLGEPRACLHVALVHLGIPTRIEHPGGPRRMDPMSDEDSLASYSPSSSTTTRSDQSSQREGVGRGHRPPPTHRSFHLGLRILTRAAQCSLDRLPLLGVTVLDVQTRLEISQAPWHLGMLLANIHPYLHVPPLLLMYDPREAIRWLRVASALGCTEAELSLERLLEKREIHV